MHYAMCYPRFGLLGSFLYVNFKVLETLNQYYYNFFFKKMFF